MQEVLHMSMFKKKKVSLPHVILYILFLFVYYTVTKNLSASVLGSIIAPLYYKIPLPILFTIGLLLIIIIPRSKCLLISWLQSPSAVILEPPKIDTS